MNNEMQAIMARRRRMADGQNQQQKASSSPPKSGGSSGSGEDLDLSLSDLQAGGVGSGGLHGSGEALHQSKSEMGNDLQSIMERRRKLADGEKVEEDKKPEPPPEPPKSALQEIMDRRRKIADGEDTKQQTAQQQQHDQAQQPSSPEPKKGSLHDIMERRRRLADGEKVEEVDQKPMEKLMLAPTATATPVKQDLKSVGVTNEMQRIMERRRKMAENTAFVDDDEDSDEELEEENIAVDNEPSERAAEPPQVKMFSPSSPRQTYQPQTTTTSPSGISGFSISNNSRNWSPTSPSKSISQPKSANKEAVVPAVSLTKTSTASGEDENSLSYSKPTRSFSGDMQKELVKSSPPKPASSSPEISATKSTPGKKKLSGPLRGGDDSTDDEDEGLGAMLKGAAAPMGQVNRRDDDDDDATEASELPETLVETKPSLASAPPSAKLSSSLGLSDSSDDSSSSDDEDVNFRAEPVRPAAAPQEKKSGTRQRTLPVVEQQAPPPAPPPEPAKKTPAPEAEATAPSPTKPVRKKKPAAKAAKETPVRESPKKSSSSSPTKTPRKQEASLDKAIGEGKSSRSKGSKASGDTSVTSSSSAGDLSKGSLASEDFTKAPAWESRHDHPGQKDGKVSVFQRDGKGVAAQWSASTKTWNEIGEVSGGSAATPNEESPEAAKVRRRKSGGDALAAAKKAAEQSDGQAARRGTGESQASVQGRRRPTKAQKAKQQQQQQQSSSATPRNKLSATPADAVEEKPSRSSKNQETAKTTEQEAEEEPVAPPPPPGSARKSPRRNSSAAGRKEAQEKAKAPAPEMPLEPEKAPEPAPSASTGFGDSAAWGDTPAFGEGDNNNNAASDAFANGSSEAAFSGAFMADFGDAAFGGNNQGATEAATPVTFSSDAFNADSNFDDAFGSPSAFDPAAGSNLFAPAAKLEPTYDNSPLTNMPSLQPGKLELSQKSVLQCQFKGPVATNPMNGNVVFCSEAPSGAVLREVDLSRGNLQTLSCDILSPDLRSKVASKYSATVRGLNEVVRVTAGLYKAKGQVRTCVAAILDLRVLETQQPLRVVAIWQWGSGFPQPVSLQSIMSPPSGGDFSYDPSSLLAADNLLFMAGQSPKGPCVFISKPSLRESWTSNSLSGSGKVSSMEVLMALDRSKPYLAIALTDKSLSVWSYKAAIESGMGKEQQSKRWLFPLCRLECVKLLNSLEASSLSETGNATGNDAKNTGYCVHLSWLKPSSSGSSMLLLSASYQNALAVFHVGLPVFSDKNGVKPLPEPTSGSSLSQSPRILPIVAKRWQGKHEKAMSTWIDFGPHTNPGLVLLMHGSDPKYVVAVLGIVNIPQFRRGPPTKEKLLQFRILAANPLGRSSSLYLLPSSDQGVTACHSRDQIYRLFPQISVDSSGTSVSSLWHPVATQPCGLSSVGDPLLEESRTDKDGIVHIYSSIQFERNKADSDGKLYDWSRPARRLWICRTVVGDNKSCSVDEPKEEKATSQFGDGEIVLGGASSEVVCEIYDESLVGLTPLRIIRCPGVDELYAVLFRPSLCSKAGIKAGVSLDATAVAFIDRSDSSSSIRIVEARDVVFLPSAPGEAPRGLILKKDGLGLTYFTWNRNEFKCELHNSYRPILGVEDDKNYVECKRIFISSGASKTSLLCVGTRLRDFKPVIVSGELVEMTSIGPGDWASLLPNVVTGRSAWLDSMEDIFTLVGLEGDDSGYRNFSLITTQRVIILSSAMEIAGECRTTRVPCMGLSPLGAFAVAFVSDDKIRYLCCLDGELSHGTISSLTSSFDTCGPFLLLAIRQDRIVGSEVHRGISLVELGQKVDAIFLSSAVTKPALLLEPLVANAVSIGGKQSQSTSILRNIIERFGRVEPLAHGESEGLGSLGTGLSSRVFQILGFYGLNHAASWLLTGTVKFERSTNTTLRPPWLPVTARTRGAMNSDAVLQILSSGDQYFSDYIKNTDDGLAAGLPRPGDSISYLSKDLASDALRNGRAIDALKTLDVVGSEMTESMIVQLSLMLEKDTSNDTSSILGLISGYSEGGLSHSSGETRLPSSIAALVLSQKSARMRGVELGMNPDQIDRWMKPLAPSLQKGGKLNRVRQRLVGASNLLKAGEKQDVPDDPLWNASCNETKHVWNEGPRREKDRLLMLDRIEDWVGRRRPVILGKEGASAARDRGALADILYTDENSFGGKSDLEDANDGWVEGVGEGRSDEANLSSYFRFSEGEEEESNWRTDGFVDLSPYQLKATLYGGMERFDIQNSTSSVDEGEPGKVKMLFDLVYGKAAAGALVLPAPRGGSVDVGVLHSSDRQSRQRCTIEFWYNIPGDLPSKEMVLVRRTFGSAASDLAKSCKVSDKESALWELALKSSGELVFRSCGGSTLRSSQKHDPTASSDEDEGEKSRPDLVVPGKWNHVCIVLSSRDLGLAECNASIFMMGKPVAESNVSMLPSGFDEHDLDSSANLKDLLQKSNLVFGLNNPANFRLTELRVWACVRSEDDVSSFMHECLNAAEKKKTFKVKIKSKKGGAATLGKGNFLAKPGALTAGAASAPGGLLSLAPTPKVSLAPQKKEETPEKTPDIEGGFTADFNAFGVSESASGSPQATPEKEPEEEPPVTLWDTALPLSQQVRSSAAAALIRGPPATRHFGGNRGGLPDFSGMERFGVGGIAICGSEKTIVWRDNEDPPALTYPIGASGAVVSDQMDDEGSEFLCCFLARDKRMVVFELQSRTVVVELQMTTKLNFWRFLPPEAGENTLCFMLVTPVGGFHWMPLDESPRPQQVWKRGPDLAGKKVVAYEEGGSNGLDGPDILSRVGLIMVTKSTGASTLESWIVPIAGDSVAVQVSDDVMGGCLCLPPYVDEGPFLPLLVAVLQIEEGVFVNVMSLLETQRGAVGLGEIAVTLEVDLAGFEDVDFEPPALAMGTFPEAICCSLANIVVVLIRRKGLIVAFEMEDGDMSLIAREGVDHYVIDAVMRYSAEVGGAEIVMLLADDENPKDGRMVSFCFRSAA